MKQMVIREIKWFHLRLFSVGAETTKNTRVKWTSQDWSCLVYVGSNIMFLSYGPYIGMFLLPNLKKNLRKGIVSQCSTI